MVDRSHFVGVLLAVGLLVALSASVGTTAGEPDPDELVKKAVDSIENEAVEAVHTQRISGPDSEVTQTVVVQQQSSGSGYLEVIDQTGEGRQQIAFNGSTVVQHDVKDGTAVRYEQPGDFLLKEYRTLGATPDEVLDHYQGEYKGTAEVDGRESYQVELSSPKERTAGLSLDIDAGDLEYEVPLHEASEKQWYLSRETWWIDKETFYPIKQTVDWVDENGNVIATATREYEKLTIGSEIENASIEDASTTEEASVPDAERISRPDLAELETKAPSQEVSPESSFVEPDVFDTRHAANAALPFDLPRIDVPATYTYDQSIVHTHEERPGVMLLYTHEQTGTKLSVQIIEGGSSPFQYGTVVHTEEISAFDGKIVVTDSGTEVVRECDDLTYRVRGPPDAETLIHVTGSVEC